VATGERGGCGEGNVHRLTNGGYGNAVEVLREMSTVWRTVATGTRLRGNGGCVLCSHPLPSGGSVEGNVHRLANGGYGNAATGERWMCLM
jgi:hypothetical protein